MILQFSTISTEAIQLFHKKMNKYPRKFRFMLKLAGRVEKKKKKGLKLKAKTQGFDKTKNSLCRK